jgi:hypothetical protein
VDDKVFIKQKSHARENAWLRNLAVRLRTHCYLAPFGGITRIRFKGFVQDVSAVSAPPLFGKVRRKN